MPVVSLRAPVALARPVDELTPAGVRDLVWEPKWDGYRLLVAGGRIYSRNGTNLTPLFPDLAPVLTALLPDDLVLDGEVIVWDPAAGRLDFEGLQARMTAGRRIRAVAARRPAAGRLRRARRWSGGPAGPAAAGGLSLAAMAPEPAKDGPRSPHDPRQVPIAMKRLRDQEFSVGIAAARVLGVALPR